MGREGRESGRERARKRENAGGRETESRRGRERAGGREGGWERGRGRKMKTDRERARAEEGESSRWR